MKKTILITGASGDIGSEICRFFIKNNYKVIGTYNKNKATIEALAEELGSDFSYYQCDLSDFNNAEKLFKNLGDISIDILVNNSGISVLGLLQDITDISKYRNTSAPRSSYTLIVDSITLSAELLMNA